MHYSQPFLGLSYHKVTRVILVYRNLRTLGEVLSLQRVRTLFVVRHELLGLHKALVPTYPLLSSNIRGSIML